MSDRILPFPRRRAAGETRGERTGERCPICSRPAVAERRPFCSARCAQIDLGRWLGERYRIPTEEPESSLSEGEFSEENGREEQL
ncbi:DNA gyrase inhibitor YacG [Aquibaculum sediminis]|uniref:DNA gyrase inhibitor YacG n=1 Tax=Aquibaculum sediminis TaxID=3231907 RepID=UPI0034537598